MCLDFNVRVAARDTHCKVQPKSQEFTCPACLMRTDVLEAGVHFGHQTRFWNPKMAPYIFGET